jgi:hypothetical protein
VPDRQNQSSFLFTPWRKWQRVIRSGRRAFSRAPERRAAAVYARHSRGARLTLAVAAPRTGGPQCRRGSAEPNQPRRGSPGSEPLRVVRRHGPPELSLSAALRPPLGFSLPLDRPCTATIDVGNCQAARSSFLERSTDCCSLLPWWRRSAALSLSSGQWPVEVECSAPMAAELLLILCDLQARSPVQRLPLAGRPPVWGRRRHGAMASSCPSPTTSACRLPRRRRGWR